MIVRILHEGQYRIPSQHIDLLNELDNQAVDLMAKGDKKAFAKKYQEILEVVRKNGMRLRDSELSESDIILPPEDVSLEEARGIFTGEGAIPG